MLADSGRSVVTSLDEQSGQENRSTLLMEDGDVDAKFMKPKGRIG